MLSVRSAVKLRAECCGSERSRCRRRLVSAVALAVRNNICPAVAFFGGELSLIYVYLCILHIFRVAGRLSFFVMYEIIKICPCVRVRMITETERLI